MPKGAPPRFPAQSSRADLSQDAEAALEGRTLLDEARAVLSAAPATLITDIDGTISPIVAHPRDATVSSVIRRSLEALAGRLALVSVISGRDETTARRLVGAQRITYIGNYGLDRQAAEQGSLAAAEDEARSQLSEFP